MDNNVDPVDGFAWRWSCYSTTKGGFLLRSEPFFISKPSGEEVDFCVIVLNVNPHVLTHLKPFVVWCCILATAFIVYN